MLINRYLFILIFIQNKNSEISLNLQNEVTWSTSGESIAMAPVEPP